MRLQIADPVSLFAAGAPDHLVQELEGALGGARIAVGKAEVGVDDADEVEFRKMVSLGHELRADDDVETSVRHVVELFAQALDQLNEIAGEHKDARVGKQLGRFLLQPFDAGADRREGFRCLAFRAFVR